jgi:hypothetical protein
MTFPRALPRLLAGALAAFALVSAGLAAGPAPAAQAQPNYRVCGVWNSSQSVGELGSGLVVKVYKGGADTCRQKLGFMIKYYGNAWQGSSAQYEFEMLSCEEFGSRTFTGADPCYALDVNAIYKYTSPNDAIHPNPASFSWWHR